MAETASMSAAITLGLDLGTSALKVVALGLDDVRLAEAEAPFATLATLPGQAEQEPDSWLAALTAAMRELARRLESSAAPNWRRRIAAIGLTGQLPTLVCLAGARPLGAAITWKDSRADAWASARLDAATRRRLYGLTGMPLDGRYLAPMLMVHHGERLTAIDTVLSAKDFLLHALTGLALTEPSTAAGYGLYDLHTRRFSEELAAFWGVPLHLLPRVRSSSTLAGPLSERGAAILGLEAGIPVSVGAADSVSAAYALSGLDPGQVSISFGTSAVILAATAELHLDFGARYLLTPHVTDGWYGREMDLLATGSGHRWLSQLCGWGEGELDRRAAASCAGANGLTFLPYLAGGEQGALWNPHLSGALLGLTLRHRSEDIARAFLEGAFYEVRRCIDVLAESSPVESLRVSGPIVRAPNTLKLLADILDRPVCASADRSPAAVGAALLARAAADLPLPDPRAAAAPARAATAAPIEPDRDLARSYASRYADYRVRSARCT